MDTSKSKLLLLSSLKLQGPLTAIEAAETLGGDYSSVYSQLQSLTIAGMIKKVGTRKNATYELVENFTISPSEGIALMEHLKANTDEVNRLELIVKHKKAELEVTRDAIKSMIEDHLN